MKTILLLPDDRTGSQEYARMLELELLERGVMTADAAERHPAAVLLICDEMGSETAEEAGRLAERLDAPILCCCQEVLAPLPAGVTAVERPMDVKRFCDSLASTVKEGQERFPATFAPPPKKEGIVIDRVLRKVTCRGEPLALTAREYDLLCYLDDHRGLAVSREDAARQVWGLGYGDTNVVDVYIRYLRKKLDERFEVRYILTVRGKGYMLREENG